MTQAIRREIVFSQSPALVWRAITDPATLAEWMFPNDFEPRVGHHFVFRVPANPRMPDGLIVRCKVIECDVPTRLAFSWEVAGVLENTQVSYRLEPDGSGTRLFFDHTGFDVSLAFGLQAMKGAEFGWAKMFKALADVLDNAASETNRTFRKRQI